MSKNSLSGKWLTRITGVWSRHPQLSIRRPKKKATPTACVISADPTLNCAGDCDGFLFFLVDWIIQRSFRSLQDARLLPILHKVKNELHATWYSDEHDRSGSLTRISIGAGKAHIQWTSVSQKRVVHNPIVWSKQEAIHIKKFSCCFVFG